MRSWSAEGTAWSDAGPQAGSQRQGRDRRAWLRTSLQRGHYELAVEEPVNQRMAVAFDELALAI